MVCYDLAHQIRCAKHTFSGRCDITPMVCCSFGGHSTPQFLQSILFAGIVWGCGLKETMTSKYVTESRAGHVSYRAGLA